MRTDRTPIEERFWKFVDKRSDDECWPWTGSVNKKGYGWIAKGGQNGGTKKAHRLSYEMHHGPIPPKALVLHKCDIPGCVNPKCLFVGTAKQNSEDMVARGRSPTRGKFGNSKFTQKQIDEVVNSPLSSGQAAEKYGIDSALIRRYRRQAGQRRLAGSTRRVD